MYATNLPGMRRGDEGVGEGIGPRNGMSNEKKQRWPASWPPFWRAALHVAIGTAAGNVALSAGTAFLNWPPSAWDEYLVYMFLWLTGEAATMLVVVPVALLGRVGRKVMARLVVAFFLGTLAIAIPVVLLLYGRSVGFHVLGGALGTLIGGKLAEVLLKYLLLPPSIGFLGFWVITATFGQESSGRMRLARWLGFAMFWLACVWFLWFLDAGECLVPSWCRPGFPELCFVLISGFVLYPATYAIIAKMLIGAAEGAKAAAKKLNQETAK